MDQSTVTTEKKPDGTTATTVKNPVPSIPNAPTSKVALLAINVRNLVLQPTKQGVPVGKPIQVTPDSSNPTKPTDVTFTPPVQADGFIITSTPLNPSQPSSINPQTVTHVADDGIRLILIFA